MTSNMRATINARNDRALHPVNRVRLWLGVLAAPAAWLAHLVLRYLLVPVACSAGKPLLLHAVSATCMTIAVAGGFLGLFNARVAKRNGIAGQTTTENARFMGVLGASLAVLFLFVMAVEVVPALLQDPCLGLPGPIVEAMGSWMGSSVAHAGVGPPDPATGARFFDDPLLAGTLAFLALWYYKGWHVLLRRAKRARRALVERASMFGAAMAILAGALCTPLSALADALFWAHMTQHLLLVTVSAPLLALSAPLAPFAHGLPAPIRKVFIGFMRVPLCRSTVRALLNPITVFLLHSAILWVWHIPLLYRAALANPALHVLEHATFLGSATAFFHVLIRSGKSKEYGQGIGMFFAFAASLQCGALGMLLMSARVPLYPEHVEGSAAWGLSLLEDQQLAGVLMWIPGGAAYALAALFLARAWLRTAALVPPWEMSCNR